MPAVEIPAGFLVVGTRGPDWRAWLDRLPRLTQELLAEWELAVDGGTAYGNCAIVLPVRTADGQRAVLKVQFPHWEAETEHLALRAWDGNGVVKLLRADPRRFAMLLERLEPRDLTGVDDREACEIVGSVLPRLNVAAGPQYRTLSGELKRWIEDFRALPASAPVPHRYVEQAISLAQDFVADPACDGRLIHTDLHYDNVLAGEREPWLVIDPKPLSGDPHYEIAPLLWNRWPEVVASGDIRFRVRSRFYTAIDAAGLDEDRARDWVIVRQMLNVLWTLKEAGTDESLPQDWLTRNIAVVKAIQD
ncbi:antimicrobial 6-kinase [Kribbella flavida DSM 17836]|uniref:Antimicrobial 6-kinase n=1 Tax=Kribbella flavida (strain DSM 17836 / JCM 10339 / NBRC 14399) TaxID=479435 RepID=D2PUZ7_KRIFD|nr:aminoglycoside phosphotransferase family protein [Kribbella flavida]ADB31463.1 antimicrobial 6-kinase [Kribbella flavida DSM 17836]